MKSFQKQRGFKNIIHSTPVLIFLGILLLFFAWSMVGFVGKLEATRENRKIAEEKIAELNKEKTQLSTDIAKLKTEEGVEASIRDKFGLAKDGEGVIVIVDDKAESKATETKSGGFWGFLKNLFK